MIDESIPSLLRRQLGEEAVLDDPLSLDFRSADALNPGRAWHLSPAAWKRPAAVVVPRSTEEVSRVLRLASEHRIPVVPFGGGTGVMGAAVSLNGGIALDLRQMSGIRSVSPDDRVAWVEAGMVLEDLNDALKGYSLMLGHDPWSLPIATVGGAISTNGVGYRAARYGPMGGQVLGLEVVLPSGDVLVTKAVPKDALGPNLNHLFIGAEGTLGVITAAALRVFRLPEERRFATYRFADFDGGFGAVAEMFAIGLRPAFTDLTEEKGEVLLYLAFEGYREEVAAQESRTRRICLDGGAEDAGPGETQEYWRERHRSGERYKRDVLPYPPQERWRGSWGRGSWDYLHMALPVSRVLEFRRQAQELCQESGLLVREYAIWTEPELFSMITVGTALEGQGNDDAFAETVDRVLRLAQDMGGTMEYCHGVGVKLGHLVEREWGTGLDVAQRIKRALDPYGIMNPGKLGL